MVHETIPTSNFLIQVRKVPSITCKTQFDKEYYLLNNDIVSANISCSFPNSQNPIDYFNILFDISIDGYPLSNNSYENETLCFYSENETNCTF